ncbi:MAG: cupin domain protein [Gemmatales bacterium]|nr:MAG: cupin domain protein [Gemmatales bacterium]
MNEQSSSCEISNHPAGKPIGSRILRCQPGFRWEGITPEPYKDSAPHHCGVERTTLVGGQGEGTAFQMRYIEIAPGGFSSLEHHQHEHAVYVVRGQGTVRLGSEKFGIRAGDVVYVAPHEVHQFRNPSAGEPLGFICVVDAQRDRPVLVQE